MSNFASINYEDIFSQLQSNIEYLELYYSKHPLECASYLNSASAPVYGMQNGFLESYDKLTALERFQQIKKSYTDFDYIQRRNWNY